MGYREHAPKGQLGELVEGIWTGAGSAYPARVLPDGCMDLIAMDDSVIVAGPDTQPFLTGATTYAMGLRFRPGVLPRLLGTPASELRNRRVRLTDLTSIPQRHSASLIDITNALAARPTSQETAPWSTGQLRHVTRALAAGAAVNSVADDLGWSTRTFQRQCQAVFGYGPAVLRRILRFRRATRWLATGIPLSEVAADAGYADQPHMHREVRALAGVAVNQVVSGANRSTLVPSGSETVA